MMMGRLGESAGGRGLPFSASTSGIAGCDPTPAATAPSTDDFTKSRRENVNVASRSMPAPTISLRAKREAYHGAERGFTPEFAARFSSAGWGMGVGGGKGWQN